MILPKNNQKSYGVLHTENYFSFIGFCKKVDSDEIQSVDVYLDDILIDTILADKKLQKIEDIYDIESFGFTYDLDEKYIGEKHTISFKNTETKEDLNNSPYMLIDNTNQNFNEARFLHSLMNINTEKTKDIYRPNNISFLATEENLESKEFVEYINELVKRFPEIEFNGFYFDNYKIFNTNFNTEGKIKLHSLNNINQIIQQSEIFIWDIRNTLDIKITNFLIKNCKCIYPIYNFKNQYFINLQNLSLEDYDNFLQSGGEIIIKKPDFFGFSQNEINLYGESYHKLMYEAILIREEKKNYTLDLKQSALEFLQFEQIKLVFLYKNFKKYFIKIHNIKNR